MINPPPNRKLRAVLLGSAALNIFLAAFVLGRLSMPAPTEGALTLPSLPLSGHEAVEMSDPMPLPSEESASPPHGGHRPPPMRQSEAMGERPSHMPPHASGHSGRMPPPPPPPFISPMDVFSREEMEQEFAQMRANFEQIAALRIEFAQKLDASGMAKEDVLSHFAEVDALMSKVRTESQQKLAERISAMSEQERKALAAKLRSAPSMPPPPPHGEH